MKPLPLLRLLLGALLLLAAVSLWGWVLWPSLNTEKVIALPEVPFSDPKYSDTVSQLDALDLSAHLRYPSRLHAGDTSVIQVTLEIADHNQDGWAAAGDSQAMMEARIDLPLAQLTPQGSIVETLSASHLPLFRWRMTARQPDRLSGQFWLYMLLVSEDGASERQALLAVPFETEINALAGLPDPILTWVACGLTLAALLVFPITHYLKFPSKSA